jgi:hypothetical protein
MIPGTDSLLVPPHLRVREFEHEEYMTFTEYCALEKATRKFLKLLHLEKLKSLKDAEANQFNHPHDVAPSSVNSEHEVWNRRTS